MAWRRRRPTRALVGPKMPVHLRVVAAARACQMFLEDSDFDLLLFVDVAIVCVIAAGIIDLARRAARWLRKEPAAGAIFSDAGPDDGRVVLAEPRDSDRGRYPGSTSAVLDDALAYARGNRLTPTHIQSVEQAIRRARKLEKYPNLLRNAK